MNRKNSEQMRTEWFELKQKTYSSYFRCTGIVGTNFKYFLRFPPEAEKNQSECIAWVLNVQYIDYICTWILQLLTVGWIANTNRTKSIDEKKKRFELKNVSLYKWVHECGWLHHYLSSLLFFRISMHFLAFYIVMVTFSNIHQTEKKTRSKR